MKDWHWCATNTNIPERNVHRIILRLLLRRDVYSNVNRQQWKTTNRNVEFIWIVPSFQRWQSQLSQHYCQLKLAALPSYRLTMIMTNGVIRRLATRDDETNSGDYVTVTRCWRGQGDWSNVLTPRRNYYFWSNLSDGGMTAIASYHRRREYWHASLSRTVIVIGKRSIFWPLFIFQPGTATKNENIVTWKACRRR